MLRRQRRVSYKCRKRRRITLGIMFQFGHRWYYTRCGIGEIKEAGVEGVVIGVLDEDGNLNAKALKELIAEAEGLSITLHRAFDMCRNPYQALEDAIALGINTILTSGQKS